MLGTQIIPPLPSIENIVVILFPVHELIGRKQIKEFRFKKRLNNPLNNMILLCCLSQANNIHQDILINRTLVIGCYIVAGDIFHLTIKKKGSLSSLLNKILLNRNTLCNEIQFNCNNIMDISKHK